MEITIPLDLRNEILKFIFDRPTDETKSAIKAIEKLFPNYGSIQIIKAQDFCKGI